MLVQERRMLRNRPSPNPCMLVGVVGMLLIVVIADGIERLMIAGCGISPIQCL